jgi:hypothetical protein
VATKVIDRSSTQKRGGCALLIRGWRNTTDWLPSSAAFACVALVLLLLVRIAPSSFPHLSSTGPAVNSDRHHLPKSCFDQNELYSDVSITVFSPAILLAFSPLMPASDPIISLGARGAHYTRPPPLG